MCTAFRVHFFGLLCTVSSRVPSYVVILEPAVFRTVGGKLLSIVDYLADGWFADDVSGASGRVSVWNEVLDMTTEINLRLCLMFAEKVQQIFPHDVSETSINPTNHSTSFIGNGPVRRFPLP